MKVLVVDDSRIMRAILTEHLSGCGFEVLQATDANEGLQQFRANSDIALVTIDRNMPEHDGMELVQWIRQEPHGEAVRLLMITSETEQRHMHRALQSGVDEYLMKPFDEAMLRSKIRLLGFPAEAKD
jgi:two-component system chemotaxis response regulator CheY